MSSTRSLSAFKIFITLHHGKSKSNPHPPEKNNPYQKKFGVLLYIRAIEERNWCKVVGVIYREPSFISVEKNCVIKLKENRKIIWLGQLLRNISVWFVFIVSICFFSSRQLYGNFTLYISNDDIGISWCKVSFFIFLNFFYSFLWINSLPLFIYGDIDVLVFTFRI